MPMHPELRKMWKKRIEGFIKSTRSNIEGLKEDIEREQKELEDGINYLKMLEEEIKRIEEEDKEN